MSAFVLFFLWLAALRRGRLRMREFGQAILVWVHEHIDAAAETLTDADILRFHRWVDWAEWAARRADPAAARRLIRAAPRDVHGLVARMAACCRVLAGAPARPPRRRLKTPRGARASARVVSTPRRLKPALRSARLRDRRARAPP
jgi:hypothetical protein